MSSQAASIAVAIGPAVAAILAAMVARHRDTAACAWLTAILLWADAALQSAPYGMPEIPLRLALNGVALVVLGRLVARATSWLPLVAAAIVLDSAIFLATTPWSNACCGPADRLIVQAMKALLVMSIWAGVLSHARLLRRAGPADIVHPGSMR